MLYRIPTYFRWARSYYRRTGVSNLLRVGSAFLRRTFSIHLLYIYAVLSVVGTVERDELKRHWKTWEFSQSAEIKISAPSTERDGQSDVPTRLLEHTGTYERGTPFVSEIENAILIGDRATPITERGVVLEAFSSRRDRLERHLLANHRELVTILKANGSRSVVPEKEFDTVCSFASVGRGYCEWIQSVLTRLEGLEQYTEQTGMEPRILLPKEPAEWMIDSLEFFGYTDDDLIVWDGGIASVDNFVVPSVRTGEYTGSYYNRRLIRDDPLHIIHPGACDWLRERAFQRSSHKQEQAEETVLYISRQNASKRRVENWNEVKPIMEKQGVTVREMETLPFEKQVQEMKQAETIVAPHGAGLINTVFSDDVTVIELFGSKVKSTYFLLNSTLHNEYHYLLCEPKGDDIIVDTNKLDTMLREQSE